MWQLKSHNSISSLIAHAYSVLPRTVEKLHNAHSTGLLHFLMRTRPPLTLCLWLPKESGRAEEGSSGGPVFPFLFGASLFV